ncbi:ABC transporter substrate-binding protein [Marispirochaeta aestuarii]|uniref:ABC transporter substrate-binding protein n=1 Tax=Marispirochaeta aestuarii TaxID=1963862 RepID=A0A1Y1RXK9_9SPIO|nr:ABC transporter substrate-binding protein [Marispirochaeta aestuarii]ORC35073.1 ABC transporter substrate-binding protein [Marispirochaeta aestuarii]
MKRTLVVLFVAVSTLAAFAGGGGESSEKPEAVTVVLDWTINTNHTGLYVARDLGFFEEEGLDVSIEFPPETGAAGLVLSGKAEFAVSYQEEVTYARAAGNALKAVAAVIQHNTSGFASRSAEDIRRPRDFEGKAYGGWGSPIEEAMVRALVEGDGGDFSKVKIVPIGSMDFFAATAGDIDFVWIFRGWDGIAAELKGIDINYIPLATEAVLDYYTPVLIARDGLLQENPELVRAFISGAARGYRYAVENPEEAADILLEAAPELDRELVVASQRYLAGEYTAGAPCWGEMKLEVWERYAEWLKENGLLEGEFVPEAAFTNEFLPR